MMSKKKWFLVLCLFIIYLLLGAGIFFNIESQAEEKRIEEERIERFKIDEMLEEMLNKSVSKSREKLLFEKLTDYCGKPLARGMGNLPGHAIWDFYHSLFFVITVVSTIGYGNLAPTTMFTRIFMIFYALIGIPMNGIVMVTLGEFFGTSFHKLYRRWKTSNMKSDTTRLGLISQIVLYLVPGFTFFIFLPAAIMVMFEGWAYDVAVYYSFVTLTTIGFGDYVAGVDNAYEYAPPSYWTYKIFLLVWIIIGLGYLVMIISFITQAMRSKKMKVLEQIITENIKKTPVKIRQELRTLLQEFLFLKVKRVYKGEFDYVPAHLERSQSCPDLSIYHTSLKTDRKRALSEGPRTFILNRIQSETELESIDKDRTFKGNDAFMQQKDLLLKVVDALGNIPNEHHDVEMGYDGFSDSEILASERYGGSQWSLNKNVTKPKRRRAISEVRAPTIERFEAHPQELTWYGQSDGLKRPRTFSEPSSETEKNPQSFLTRLRNKFVRSNSKNIDIEKQNYDQMKDRRRASMFTTPEDRYIQTTRSGRPSVLSIHEQEAVLENTSIADFIRALSAITVPETMLPSPSAPRRKLGTASLTPPKQTPPRTRRIGIRPNLQVRRTSLLPESPVMQQRQRRRFSLRPVEENLSGPPPYSPLETDPPAQAINRRFSRVLPAITVTPSPVQRQVNKKDNKDDQ